MPQESVTVVPAAKGQAGAFGSGAPVHVAGTPVDVDEIALTTPPSSRKISSPTIGKLTKYGKVFIIVVRKGTKRVCVCMERETRINGPC